MSEEERAAFKQEIAAIDAESNPPMPPLNVENIEEV
jgi:hypothetical protein